MRLSLVVSAVIAVLGAFAIVVMISMSPANLSKPKAPDLTKRASTGNDLLLAVPHGFSESAELMAEYRRLQSDFSGLKTQLRRLRARIRDEAFPPDLAGLPAGLAGFGQAVLRADPQDRGAIASTPPPNTVDTDTIFVSVASFRDDHCYKTVRDMYLKAKNPRRLFLGIIEQNEPEDKGMECVPAEYAATCPANAFCPTDNIRVRRVRARDAKGPTFGRFVAMLMYRGEKYFMMIDSHNRFVKEWDSRMISMYRQIPSKKGVLSHYPNSWIDEKMNLEDQTHITVMCNGHYIGLGFIRMDGFVMPRSALPRLQPFSAAGFLFADAKLVQEVPFDPYLDYLFDGEEILYSARMWTHGWDMYAPSYPLLYHFYGRSHAPRVWAIPGNNWWGHQQVSNARVQMFLKAYKENTTELMVKPEAVQELTQFQPHERDRLVAEAARYGLGKERSLEEYWKFAMVDPVKRQTGLGFCLKARDYGRE